VVEAATGVIGGKFSHEFIVLAENGEEKLVYCPDCSYCANHEMAECIPAPGKDKKDTHPSEGDRCIRCKKELKFDKGIEIGHIFMLGKKYSDKLGAKFLDIDGKLKSLVMGCYGIGISRMLSAAVEQLHDDRGIIWPLSIAPFTVNIVSTTSKNKEMSDACDKIYQVLKESNIDVLYDDRDVSAGIKFKDSDLIGIPVRFIIGQKFLKDKLVDVEYRKDGKTEEISIDGVPKFIKRFKTKNSLK
jgi:prolyl-tRNA synthetase